MDDGVVGREDLGSGSLQLWVLWEINLQKVEDKFLLKIFPCLTILEIYTEKKSLYWKLDNLSARLGFIIFCCINRQVTEAL